MTSVDIVVPCYNYARYLPGCIDSILSQEGVDVRVLIIDDCSQDNSDTVGRALAAQDSRVEFRRHAQNCGHISTYNEGLLGWASADYSLLLSADDLLTPGALQRTTDLMERHPELGMTYGLACSFCDDDELAMSDELVSNEYRIVSSDQFLRRCFTDGNFVPTPTAVVRTELQQALGGYRSDLPHTGDLEMWMRFAVHAPVGVVRALQAFKRRHNGNMSNQYFNRLLGDQREVLQACEQILSQWGGRFPEAGLWREIIRKCIGERAYWSASEAFDQGDVDGCRSCMEFAVELYPEIRGSKIWWKFQIKRMIGQLVWKKIHPTWNRLRTSYPSPEPAKPSPMTQLAGWWPEPRS